MKRERALEIIKNERLENYNLNESRYNKENEVAIKKENDIWIVYATDERASMITNSKVKFSKEEDAWDNFIKRLRAGKVLKNLCL